MTQQTWPDRDVLIRFILPAAAVRGAVVRLDASWQQVLSRHPYSATVAALLGEAVGAAAVLSSIVKLDGSLILQTQSDGPLNTLVAHATSERTIRGLARYTEPVSDRNLQEACGDGKLVITMDSGGGERYQGIVLLEGDSLGHAIEAYFAQSEQLKTRVWLQADASSASAILLQELGDADRTDEADLDGWTRITTLADTIESDELLQVSPTRMLYRLFHEEELRILEAETVAFSCGCSVERIETVLRSLGANEVSEIVAEKGQVDVDCEFCNRHFTFTPEQATALFTGDSDDGEAPTLH